MYTSSCRVEVCNMKAMSTRHDDNTADCTQNLSQYYLPSPAPPQPAQPHLTHPAPHGPCPALPCPALPCPALPCPALPSPAQPSPALPCPAPNPNPTYACLRQILLITGDFELTCLFSGTTCYLSTYPR